MTEGTEFVCQDCGCWVYSLSQRGVSRPERCAVCAWISEHIPVEEQPAVRVRLARRLHCGGRHTRGDAIGQFGGTL